MKIATAALIVLLTSCSFSQHGGAPETPSLVTVAHVDLDRYLGLWYEIGRYPNSFQEGCLDSTAMYKARTDGDVDILNSCRDEQDGRLREARGRAWVVGPGNARLKVSFFWPFRGDYWIMDVGEEYEYAVIGTPNRKYLWILSRTPSMHPEVLAGILQDVEKQGFDPDKLLFP
ncbi:MAG: hypothetical protein A2X81_17880 [Desulfobacterales bacterium GWB2_56_26]|nr:MAG: hypothetical protein A2X81_17880 [Desulfobacterales bacterium GWB2_56_26]